MSWDDAETRRCQIDFRFTENAWAQVATHPLMDRFNSGAGMEFATNARIGERVLLPCEGGGGIDFPVLGKMWFGGGLATYRPLMLTLGEGVVFGRLELDVFDRLLTGGDADAIRRLRARDEDEAMAKALADARARAIEETRAQAITEAEAQFKARSEELAAAEARFKALTEAPLELPESTKKILAEMGVVLDDDAGAAKTEHGAEGRR